MSINVEAEKRAYKKFRQAGMTAAGGLRPDRKPGSGE